MNIDKIILTFAIMAGTATSVRAIYDYLTIAPTVNAQEMVQEQPIVPTPNQDAYIPTSAPSGVCNGGAGGAGGCGCGG